MGEEGQVQPAQDRTCILRRRLGRVLGALSFYKGEPEAGRGAGCPSHMVSDHRGASPSSPHAWSS